MPGRYFVDSNVVLYLYSEDEPAKKAPAEVVTHGQRDELKEAVACDNEKKSVSLFTKRSILSIFLFHLIFVIFFDPVKAYIYMKH